jgi:hypothetical protein
MTSVLRKRLDDAALQHAERDVAISYPTFTDC